MKLTFINPTYSRVIITYTFYYSFTILTYIIFTYLFLPISLKKKVMDTVELFGAKKLFYSFIQTKELKDLITTLKSTNKTMKYKVRKTDLEPDSKPDLETGSKLKEQIFNGNLSGEGEYSINDTKEFYGGSGSGAYYEITKVDSNSKITEFKIVNGGKGYKEGDILEFKINQKIINTLKDEINKILELEIEESKDTFLLKANLDFFKKTIYFYLVCLVLILFVNLVIFNSSKNEYKKEIKKIFSGNTYIVMIASNIFSGLVLFGLTYIVSNSIALPYLLFKAVDFFLIYFKERSETFLYLINMYLSINNEDILFTSSLLDIGSDIGKKKIQRNLNISDDNYQTLNNFSDKLKTFNQKNWNNLKEFLLKN